jgi:ATP phosphoribosyltransferase
MAGVMNERDGRVTLALPSKGAMAKPTMDFFGECGLRVWKPNPRQYTGQLPALPNVDVMFQRVKDVVYKVADGTAQLGITGLDVVHEYSDEKVMVIHPALNYGQCQLLVAVPEAWVDVETMHDLADIAFDIRQQQKRNLRVATTYTRSARQFLHDRGIHHFTLVKSDGAIEAAPTLGYADVVVDLTQTGTTLRENRLRPLTDGVIISSEACLVGNREALREDPALLETVRLMLEYMEASLNGRRYYQLTANIVGASREEVAAKVLENEIAHGLQGPTISQVFVPGDETWFSVTIVVKTQAVLEAVEHLRRIGGAQTTAQPTKFVFMQQSEAFTRLRAALGLGASEGETHLTE